MENQHLLILLFLAIATNAQNTSLDDLIKNIFNTDGVNTPTPDVLSPLPTKTTVLGPNIQPQPANPESTSPAGSYESCGFEKECVPRFLCNNETGIIKTDGLNIISIRIDNDRCQSLELCCDIPNKVEKPIIDAVPPIQNDGCGYQNPDGVGFKISGDTANEAEFGEFPWMVAVLREEYASGDTLNLYECGGALIAPTVVVTAAHCVQTKTANTLVVRAGEWDTQTKQELLPHQDRRVKEIIVHENYNKGALFNDIALLIVESPYEYEENVRPLCLPDSNVNFDYSRCYATGWGKNKFGKEGTYQVILKKIDLPVVPNNECETKLQKTRLGHYFKLDKSFLCAGGEGKDTCKGDGGSPLVCPIPGTTNRFYHAGIVAWGIDCAVKDVPGVYANVPFLRSWLNEKLQQRNIDFSHFTP